MGCQDEHFILESVLVFTRLSLGRVETDEDVAEVGDRRETDVVGLQGRVGEHVGRSLDTPVADVAIRDRDVIHEHNGDVPVLETQLSEQGLEGPA